MGFFQRKKSGWSNMEFREVIRYGGKPMFLIKDQKGVRLSEAIITGDQVIKPLDPPPWLPPEYPPERVDVWELYQAIYVFVYTYVDLLRVGYYAVVAMWVMASWLQEALPIAVYLNLLGRMETGKTKLIVDVLRELAYRGIPSTVITGPGLFRTVQEYRPTLLIDESEFITKKKEDLIAVINAGYRRGVKVIRIEEVGKRREPRTYDVFGFKAMGGTEELNEITASRNILLKMHKLRRPLKMFVDQRRGEELRSSLLRFRIDHLDAFQEFVEPKAREAMVHPLPLSAGEEGEDAPVSPRISEIFFPLIALTEYLNQLDHRFEGVKGSIEEVKKQLSKERRVEEKAGENAKMVQVLLQKRAGKQEWTVSVADAAAEFNRDVPEKSEERISRQKAGVMLSRLGFEKVTLPDRKAGYLIREDLMMELASDYGIQFLTWHEERRLVLDAVKALKGVTDAASKVKVQEELAKKMDRAEVLRVIAELTEAKELEEVDAEHMRVVESTPTVSEATAEGGGHKCDQCGKTGATLIIRPPNPPVYLCDDCLADYEGEI